MAASSLEQKLSRLEAKLKQENREARRRIELEISPQRPRPTLQLPLANDGHSRSDSSAHHHPSLPVRPRHMLNIPQTNYVTQRSLESTEIDQKLQEIIKQTGYLLIDGQKYQADINDLENLGEIGSGTCGQVWKMRFKKTGPIIAVKQMRRSGNKEENKRILMDLDVVLKSHDCPYIVQCYGTFITNTDVFIAMELMGTCAEKLKKRIQGPIPERILGKMTVAIVNALYYLKEKHGVIHRDVKPSNILLDASGRIKLCDFGISGRLVDSKAKTRSAGCAAYMAPERIDPPDPTKPDYDIRADVWSLGISLVELATGQFPYKNCKTDFEVLTKVLQEEPPVLPHNMGFSPVFQSFVKDCLTKDHRKRPKYNKLLIPLYKFCSSANRMQLLILITLCLRMVQGPPPWLRSFHVKNFPQAVPPESFSTTCQNVHNITSATLGGSPCMSMEVSGHSLVDSAVVQLLVRGPDKQCEHGGICSMKVGSQVQAEVSLSAAPPSLGLSLTLCSLSASSNPFNQSHIPLLVNDCPYSAGVTFTLVTPKPCINTPPKKSFSFQLDHFYNSSIQFLHCKVELCLQETQCGTSNGVTKLPQCHIPGVPCTPFTALPSFFKPMFHRTVTQPLLVTISAPSRNPLQSLPGYKRSPLSTGREYSVQEVRVVAVIGVTLCSFFLGMMLTIGLWCIHKKTVPTYQGTQTS